MLSFFTIGQTLTNHHFRRRKPVLSSITQLPDTSCLISFSSSSVIMARFAASVLVALVTSLATIEQCHCFMKSPVSTTQITTLSMAKAESSVNRRKAFAGIAAAFATVAVVPQEASAKYSDYARREKDWEDRTSKGEVKISSARDLRAQLAEIAPMNTSGSKIFCPNGPSANVSPLMENKCSDRLAAPSVYGRSNDVMGNSIPGFKDGYAWMPGESSSVSAAAGGFPTYKENEWKVREYGK